MEKPTLRFIMLTVNKKLARYFSSREGLFKNKELQPSICNRGKIRRVRHFPSALLFYFLNSNIQGKSKKEYYKVSLLCLVIIIGHESSPFWPFHFK